VVGGDGTARSIETYHPTIGKCWQLIEENEMLGNVRSVAAVGESLVIMSNGGASQVWDGQSLKSLPNMTRQRNWFTSSVLPNGGLLVMGGDCRDAADESVKLFMFRVGPFSSRAEFQVTFANQESSVIALKEKCDAEPGSEEALEQWEQATHNLNKLAVLQDTVESLFFGEEELDKRKFSLRDSIKSATDYQEKKNCQMLLKRYEKESELEDNTRGMPLPSMWSMSFEQLLEIRRDAQIKFGWSFRRKTMRDVCAEIVKPTCERTKKSCALYKNENGLPCQAFVTHAWDEPFGEFVDSIEKVHQANPDKPNLWICTFALLQDECAVKQELDTPLEETPFVSALKDASEFVVVRNSKTDICSRLWCVCELMYAIKYRLYPGKLYVTGPDLFSKEQTSCLHAKATSLDDHEKILRELLSNYGHKEIDEAVDRFRKHPAPK